MYLCTNYARGTHYVAKEVFSMNKNSLRFFLIDQFNGMQIQFSVKKKICVYRQLSFFVIFTVFQLYIYLYSA